MPSPAQIVAWEVRGFLLALFGIVAAQLLNGQISTRNLLYGRKNDLGQPVRDAQGNLIARKSQETLYFSPDRVQLLMLTLSAALYYLTQVLNNPTPGTFPPIPTNWTATVAGSNVLYLGGKALARFWPRPDVPK
jgi:hypothetical protein